MHTEAEAREKWCPFARCAMRGDEDDWHVMCFASGCMAWRWGAPKFVTHEAPKPTEKIEHGYCGLAGRP